MSHSYELLDGVSIVILRFQLVDEGEAGISHREREKFFVVRSTKAEPGEIGLKELLGAKVKWPEPFPCLNQPSKSNVPASRLSWKRTFVPVGDINWSRVSPASWSSVTLIRSRYS